MNTRRSFPGDDEPRWYGSDRAYADPDWSVPAEDGLADRESGVPDPRAAEGRHADPVYREPLSRDRLDPTQVEPVGVEPYPEAESFPAAQRYEAVPEQYQPGLGERFGNGEAERFVRSPLERLPIYDRGQPAAAEPGGDRFYDRGQPAAAEPGADALDGPGEQRPDSPLHDRAANDMPVAPAQGWPTDGGPAVASAQGWPTDGGPAVARPAIDVPTGPVPPIGAPGGTTGPGAGGQPYGPNPPYLDEPPGRLLPPTGAPLGEGVYRTRRPGLAFILVLLTLVFEVPALRLLLSASLAGQVSASSVVAGICLVLGLPALAVGVYGLSTGAAALLEPARGWLRPPAGYLVVGLALMIAAALAAN